MTKPTVRAIRLSKVKKETGATSTSLDNFQEIVSKGYKPIIICFEKDNFTGCGFTKIYFAKDNNYNNMHYSLFTGFNAGYWGEGTRALYRVLLESNFRTDEKALMRLVSNLEDNIRHIFLLDNNYDGLHHIRITKSNMHHCTTRRNLVRLKTEKPIIYKSI